MAKLAGVSLHADALAVLAVAVPVAVGHLALLVPEQDSPMVRIFQPALIKCIELANV